MDRLTYQQAFGHDLLEVTAATGSHQVYGWSPAFAIVVREDNPITQISLKELDVYSALHVEGVTMEAPG
jgi:phosphate transport system substrate-binding protein